MLSLKAVMQVQTTLNILMDKAQNIQKNKKEIQAKELNQLKDQYKSLSPP